LRPAKWGSVISLRNKHPSKRFDADATDDAITKNATLRRRRDLLQEVRMVVRRQQFRSVVTIAGAPGLCYGSAGTDAGAAS
jgi:hypothetical protein